ncbi:MAG: hypothetical protein Q4Q06_02385 [Bacteroidota bacterium]|nr:hypothetical protein [Bacteroidota bacterium]
MEKVPVLFIIFNRLDFVTAVFEPIRKYKPTTLFIAQDGAREVKNEAEKNKQVRQWVLNNIDWECEVKTMFLSKNLGAGRAVSSFLKWFFAEVEYGIVLEHDCLVGEDFFDFCSQLLIKYKDNENVFTISGFNVVGESKESEESYFFTHTQQLWGWAAWQRTFKDYDIYLKDYTLKEFKRNIKDVLIFKNEKRAFTEKFLAMKKQAYNTWDMQLWFYTLRHKGLNIEPKYNLVSNIGFTKEALHCKNPNSPLANTKTYKILPLTHPKEIKVNNLAEEKIYKKFWYKSYLQLIARFLDRVLFLKKQF